MGKIQVSLPEVVQVHKFRSCNGGLHEQYSDAVRENVKAELHRLIQNSDLYFSSHSGCDAEDVVDFVWKNHAEFTDLFRQLRNALDADPLIDTPKTNAEHVERCVDEILKK